MRLALAERAAPKAAKADFGPPCGCPRPALLVVRVVIVVVVVFERPVGVCGWCGQANESPHHHHHRPCFFARSNASFKPLNHTHLPTLYRTDSTHRSCTVTRLCFQAKRDFVAWAAHSTHTQRPPRSSPSLPSPKRCFLASASASHAAPTTHTRTGSRV